MKYSSFEKQQKLFENFRRFLKEADKEKEQLNELKKADLPFIKKFLAIKDLPLAQYVANLKKMSGNPAVRAIALAGQTDTAGPGDEAIATSTGDTKRASELLPTQKDIGFFNSLKDQVTNAYKSTQTVLETSPIKLGPGGGSAILIYAGRYILDGHHRWSQVMMTNPEGEMLVDDISGAALGDVEGALKATQLAIAGYTGDLKTKPLGGPDLMKASPEAVQKYVIKTITDEVLQLLVTNGKIPKPDKNLAAKYFVQNLKNIKKNPGKFDRETSMPQADFTGGKGTQGKVNQLLKKGAINFDDPSPKDVKKK